MKHSPERVILTNMCMIRDEDCVLALKKNLKDGSTGITFPGGHTEKEEPVYDSVIREIKEETGLTILHPHFCGIKEWIEEDGVRYIVFLYRADAFDGTLQSTREGEVFWVKREELLNLPYIWHLDKMLEVFEKDDISECTLDHHNAYKPVLK